jgi:hypothetical protein
MAPRKVEVSPVQRNGTTPKFSKQHYEAIAEVIQETLSYERSPCEQAGIHGVQYYLSQMFERDNPNFDAGRFERACRLGANVRARC